MDVAAIDRLMRRFGSAVASAPAPVYAPAPISTPLSSAPITGAPLSSSPLVETTVSAPAPQASAAPEAQNDELAGSIRAMFNSYRK